MKNVMPLALPFALGVAMAAPLAAMTQDDVLQAGLMPGWRTDSGHQMAGLSLALAPGWKTYWRSPGEAGIPPQFDWTGSVNVQSVRVHWPSPVIFRTNGMVTVGYTGSVVFPLEVVPVDASQPVSLSVHVDLGICKDICMPATVAVTAALPPSPDKGGPIQAALQARPETGDQAGLSAISCAVEPIADGLRVTARLALPRRGGEEGVVFEPADRSVWVSEAVVSREGGVLTAVAEMVAPSGAPFALDRSQMVITVLGGARAAEIKGCPAP
jgi:DsbC/DsbD-like thiol-disulfide interchange protein